MNAPVQSPSTVAAGPPRPPPTLGPLVCQWIEKNLVHGAGDFQGRPVRLRPDQRAFVWRAYEVNGDGSRRWRRVVRGRAKGDGKTELAAMLACAELAGPVDFAGFDDRLRPRGRRRRSPDIPVVAASFEQADLLFGAAKQMLAGGPLADAFETFDAEILFADGTPGRLYRVAAVAGTNDGGRPTFVACDETHELTGNKKRVHLVLSNSLQKRTGGWALEITTAGAKGAGSVAEDAYELAKRIGAGLHVPGVIVDWLEAEAGWDLDDPAQLEAAIRQANPAADVFWPLQNLVARYHDPSVPRHEFARYHLNRWVAETDDSWLADRPGAWHACRGDAAVPAGSAVWVGVDVSLTRDATAVVYAHPRDDGRVAVSARVWEPGDGRVDHLEVMGHLRALTARFDVRRIDYDPRFFEVPAQLLLDEGLPMVEVPQSPERMVPACGHAYEQIVAGRVVHDGDPVLEAHVLGAVRRVGDRGWTLSKGRSRRHIDACVALVLALWSAAQTEAAAPAPSITYL